MSYNRRLTIIAIITYLLLILLAAYFKYFPMIINATITNVLIFLMVFILISLLVYGGFIIKESKDIYLLLPQSLIFVFIARAVPNLRLSYPPLHDPYFHFVAALNVINFGTLEPILGWWYSGTDVQLHWPIMHLLTTALVNITNVDVMQFFRYQEPAMGVIFFLAVFMLAKTLINNNGVAIISALFASLSDVIIFYQSEYHPQGLAIIFFILLLYAFIKSRQINNICFRYVALIFSVVFILSHYFTPLFLALIFGTYAVLLLTVRSFSSLKFIQNRFYEIVGDIKSDFSFVIIIVISSIAYHFLVYSVFLYQILGMVRRESPLNVQLVSIGQQNVPLLTSILSSSKWGIFFLAAISVLWILKTKNTNEFRLSVFFICIIIAGIIGNYVVASPLDRIIAFYIPFAAVFASLTLFRFKSEWYGGSGKSGKIIVALLIASIIMTAGFFNSQTPAYFFKESGVNTYYWYSNRLPEMDEYKAAGEWFGTYASKNSKVGTEFDTRIIPFFYGKSGYNYGRREDIKYSGDYIMINPEIPYVNYNITQKMHFYENLNTLYANGEINLYNLYHIK
jgi:hypothetical protein